MREWFSMIVDGWSASEPTDEMASRVERIAAGIKVHGPLLPNEAAVTNMIAGILAARRIGETIPEVFREAERALRREYGLPVEVTMEG